MTNPISTTGKNKRRRQEDIGGFTTNTFLFPVILILLVMHVAISMMIMGISRKSAQISSTMQESSEYINTATSLLAGSSLMSETSSHFILLPVTADGNINMMSLSGYASELSQPRRGKDVIAKFDEFDVTEEQRKFIKEAAECTDYMMESQLHAIALVTSVYEIPDKALLDSLSLPALSEVEQAYTEEEKLAAAKELIIDPNYSANKKNLSMLVNACADSIRESSSLKAAAISKEVVLLRTMLWVMTFAVIAVLILTFAIGYRQLILPLKTFVRHMDSETPLSERKGLREVRQVAVAYNDLLDRRNALDSILRAAAETDTLTNLPNRYGFEQYIVESGKSGFSLAVMLFDVNYLKQTNDAHGHSAGDDLLLLAAECISSCFRISEENNCFRFGGDEFAAVLKDVGIEDIKQRIERFKTEQSLKNVSISWGFAYTPEIGNTTVRALMEEADRKMYEVKKQMHDNINIGTAQE